MNYLALALALFSGVAMAIQGSMNSALAKQLGLLEATFVVHSSATLIVAVLLGGFNLGVGHWERLTQLPWYLYLGGFLGVAITYGVIASIPRTGVAIATTMIIAGQVTTALVVDHLGLFGLEKMAFTWVKMVGLVLLALGARLMLN